MVHHGQTRPSILPLTKIEDRDDRGFSVLFRVAGDDGVYLFTVFFVEFEFDLCTTGEEAVHTKRLRLAGVVRNMGEELTLGLS